MRAGSGPAAGSVTTSSTRKTWVIPCTAGYGRAMPLPVRPPVAPMLARLARELPVDGYLYEPKWDGFRCLAFRDGPDIDLRSRHDRRFTRYFPEVVEGLE